MIESGLYFIEMASKSQFDDLDDEVKELLLNYKHKKATTYEPCTLKNYKECLIGLGEELSIFNISYVFNPYIDVEDDVLCLEALVKLINAVWSLLHVLKNTTEKTERLVEQNHILEQNNKQLNCMVGRLKEKSSSEKNEARACIATAQRISDRSDDILKNLTNARAKLNQLTKQKVSTEKGLHIEIARLKLENEKLVDRLRNKSNSYTPCSEVCDSTLLQLKEREKKQRAVISQLETNNQQLLREMVAMKQDLILGGMQNFNLGNRQK